VTRWVTVQEDGFPGVWSVARVERDGTTTYPRNRWRGISCIDAQVIVAELESAYEEGRAAGAREVFEEALGD
jgi:hypothetical protein